MVDATRENDLNLNKKGARMDVEKEISDMKLDISEIKSDIKKIKEANSGGFFSMVKGAAMITAINKISNIEKIVTEIKNKR